MTSKPTEKLSDPDDKFQTFASASENLRVGELLVLDLEERVASGDVPDLGKARGAFAKEWVALCAKLGIRGPGDENRTGWADDRTRKLSAANTRLRQFLKGNQEREWVLVGIESVICDRKGLALPGKAYQTQGRLPV